MSTALILGATGQTGQKVLKELLASSHYSRVFEYGRRLTNKDALPENVKDKLEQKVIDFEKLEESGLKDGKWDVVFITLGTTKKNAGSAEAFVKIDREYVINAAREAKSSDPNYSQRLVYCSSNSADINSSFLYPKSKAITEQALAYLGYADTIIFRPGILAGVNRAESRLLESVALVLTSVLSHISSNLEIKIDRLGKAMALAGSVGSAGLPAVARATQEGADDARYTVVSNAGANDLALAN